ncbi:MAG: hypothetical protein JWP59_3252 [Massilia sp.]|nr:hypothetical protein [Massilia sp.]
MEVELKLLVDAQYRDALLHHPLLNPENATPPREQKQFDTYFDTPDQRLHRRHIDLRVRRAQNRWLQTVKGDGHASNAGAGAGGLHRRDKWEWPVAGPTPELGRLKNIIDDKQVLHQLSSGPALKKRLAPVFATRVTRTVWQVPLADGGLVECALDLGAIESGGKDAPISELELELKAGDVGQLFDLALGLQQDVPLHLGNRSNAERGYALLASAQDQPVKASAPALSPQMTAEQAFLAIVSNCLAHMQGNEQGVAEGRDVEGLHQMRVGMRRLRSALGMYQELITLPADLQAELDWLAGELGEARDWDVLSTSTLPAVAKKSLDGADLAGVQQLAAEQAQEHRQRTAAAVVSPRYTRLMLNISRWLWTRGWRAGGTAPAANDKLLRPVGKFARTIVERNHARLRKRATGLRGATPAARHRLRIAAKKSRYAAEFFAALFSAGSGRRYVQGLSRLQDELGLLNDYAVAARLLPGLAEAHPELDGSIGFVRGVLAAQADSAAKDIVKSWKAFAPVAVPH